MEKSLGNTTASQAKENVSDLVIWGDGDMFKLLCKASSKEEGWMKSSKAMEIPGVGCVVQVTTQQTWGIDKFSREGAGKELLPTAQPLKASAVAEALTFVPGVRIHTETDNKGKVTSRRLVKDNNNS